MFNLANVKENTPPRNPMDMELKKQVMNGHSDNKTELNVSCKSRITNHKTMQF